MTNLDEAARMEVSAYPLIVYVHVPKTAGSTVKNILGLCTPRGNAYVEFLIDNKAELLDLARNSDWIAGHLPRDRLANRLSWLDRPIEYFSNVREPAAQLASHLNFSIERYRRSNYYSLHSIDEQLIDAEVMLTEFSNPNAVIALLLRHSGLHLNIQSRHILGEDFAEISDGEVARRLATYTYVAATETNLPKLYRAFGFAQLPDGVDEIHENVATPHISAQIFENPKLREFLANHHKHDLRLYAAVRRASWPAEGRRPFRPSLLGMEVFTFENFDEQAYLHSNPDVAAAIGRGDLESGSAHFHQCGYSEARMNRQWIFAPAGRSEQKDGAANVSGSSALMCLRRLREERARRCGRQELA